MDYKALLKYYLDCLYFESYMDVQLTREAVESGKFEEPSDLEGTVAYARLERDLADDRKEAFIGYPTVKVDKKYIPLVMWKFDRSTGSCYPFEEINFHQYVFKELKTAQSGLLQELREKAEQEPAAVLDELKQEFLELIDWIGLQEKEIIWAPILFTADKMVSTTWNVTEEFEKLFRGEQQLSSVAQAYFSGDVTGVHQEAQAYHLVRSNYPQNKAVSTFGERITVIQGPPGTGKTQTILNMIAKQVIEGKNVLIASTNNTAVDNILEKFIKEQFDQIFPGFLRLGSKKVIEESVPLMREMFARVLETPNWDRSLEDLEVDFTKQQRESAELYHQLNRIEELEERLERARLEAQTMEAHCQQLMVRIQKDGMQALVAHLQKSNQDYLRLEQTFRGFLTVPETIEQPASFLWKLIYKLLGFLWKTPHPQIVRKLLSIDRTLRTMLLDQLDEQDQLASLSKLHDVLQFVVIQHDLHQVRQRVSGWEQEMATQSTALSELYEAKRTCDKRLIQYAWQLIEKRVRGDHVKQQKIEGCIQQFADNQRLRKRTPTRDFEAFQELFPVMLTSNLSVRNFVPYGAQFDLVIVDEASQCSILSMISLLQSAKRICIIGDDKQLPHIPALTSKLDQKLLAKAELGDISFQYSHRNLSAFDRALFAIQGDRSRKHLLAYHYRCAPSIIEFCNREFYFNQLVVMTEQKQPNMFTSGVHFVDVPDGKNRDKLNLEEVERICRLVNEIRSKGISTIGVVTPFRKQATELRRRLPANVKVGTIHKFQGGECEAILFSTVIAPGSPARQVQFAQANAELINVAVTRAIKLLIVVGHEEGIKAGTGYLTKLTDYIRSLNKGRDSYLPPLVTLVSSAQKRLLHAAESEMLLEMERALQGWPVRLIPKVLIKNTLSITGHMHEDLYRYYVTAAFDGVVYEQDTYVPLFAFMVDGHPVELEQTEKLCEFADDFPLVRIGASSVESARREITDLLTRLRIL